MARLTTLRQRNRSLNPETSQPARNRNPNLPRAPMFFPPHFRYSIFDFFCKRHGITSLQPESALLVGDFLS